MMKCVLYSLFISFAFSSAGQDTNRVQILDEVVIEDGRIFKRLGLYDAYERDIRPNIRGFDQLSLYDNDMSDQVWASKNVDCITLTQQEDATDKFLKLKWNKDYPGCDWVGFGFGWDFWSGKNMSGILDTAAIQLQVRSTGKDIGNLAWAMGFEDYSNGQAWIGFSKQFIEGGVITKNWTKVTIPLALFPFVQMDCDPSNIKQMLFQVFASDDLEINSIEVVPFVGKLKNEIVSRNLVGQTRVVDGRMDDWENSSFEKFGNGHSFSMAHTNGTLYLAVKLNDATPYRNKEKGADLWKGDAIEFAFSTNQTADPKRTSFLLSDYHFGLNLGSNPYLWNWPEDQLERQAKFAVSTDGKFVEIEIPLIKYTKTKLFEIKELSFEIAVDQSESGTTRTSQERWIVREAKDSIRTQVCGDV